MNQFLNKRSSGSSIMDKSALTAPRPSLTKVLACTSSPSHEVITKNVPTTLM